VINTFVYHIFKSVYKEHPRV